MDDLDLSALIASRLCHDLISPVAAVNNGLEVLAEEDDPEMRTRAIELIAFSAGEAARRLQFFRLAVGSSGGHGDAISLRDARDVAGGLFQEGKIALEWPETAVNVEPAPRKAEVKLLLTLLAVGGECLARGGTLSVRIGHNGAGLALGVTAAGPGAHIANETQALLAAGDSPPESLTARAILPYLAARLAASLNARIEATSPEIGTVTLSTTI